MRKLARGVAVAAAMGVWPAAALEVQRLAPGERIVVDGRLDEPAWARAAPHDRFWEVFPRAEVPASVRTEVRFAYDRHALYAFVRAHDDDLSQLREPFARRDNVLSDQDMVVLTIDPVGNRKFGHFFRVNPRGSIGDGLYNEDSGTEDFSPDFEFEVAAGRFPGGWTAEFRIPFSSLRYTDPPSREWSFMVFRNQPRDQRLRSSTSRLPREQTCFLCLNEPLTGLDDLPPTRHLALTPNATVRSVEIRADGQPRSRETDVVPSLDVKWRPRADFVVDATINPDFSQVELDAPQVSANAQFALFFPEKRPFFLEGADILESPYRAIYTRSVTDPSWGLRGTQRSGRFDGTVLVSRDDGGGLVLLPDTYGTGFAAQDFASLATFARGRWQAGGATLGALFTDRTLEHRRGHNRVAGPDIAWFPTIEHRVRAQVLGSWTTALAEDGVIRKGPERASHAAYVDWGFRGREWEQYVRLEHVGADFRADNGFITQNGYRRILSETARKFLGLWGFNEVTPYMNLEHTSAVDGGLQARRSDLGLRLGLPRATMLSMEVRPNSQVAVRRGGGVRKRDQLFLGVDSNPFPWFSKLYMELALGDRVDVSNNRVGRGAYLLLMANLRPHPRAEVEYRIEDDHIGAKEDVEGSARIVHQRAQQLLAIWHFTARDSVRAIWQDSAVRRARSLWERPVPAREDGTTLSVVYGHRRGIGATFYVGANFTRTRVPDLALRAWQSELFVKGSWTFDVL